MQVFKYVLQYLRARRDSKAFSLPASLSSDTAAAVAEEAVFLGLPELQKASIRPTGGYEYDFTYYQLSPGANAPKWPNTYVKPGWELVSTHLACNGSGNTNTLVVCRRLKPSV